MRLNWFAAALVFSLLNCCPCTLHAEDAPKPDNTPPAEPPKNKKVSEEERDQKKEKKIRIEGRITIETDPKSDGSKKTDKDYDGYLFTKTGPIPFRAEDEEVLAELRAKAGETATLEGRLKEEQEKWLLVKRLVERTQPPSDVRNPRGL